MPRLDMSAQEDATHMLDRRMRHQGAPLMAEEEEVRDRPLMGFIDDVIEPVESFMCKGFTTGTEKESAATQQTTPMLRGSGNASMTHCGI